MARAVCPACQHSVLVNANGLLRVHGPLSSQCPGSNSPESVQTTTSPVHLRNPTAPLPSTSSIAAHSPHSSPVDLPSDVNGSRVDLFGNNTPLRLQVERSLQYADAHEGDGHYLETHEVRDMFLCAYGASLHEHDPTLIPDEWSSYWKTITQLSGVHYCLPRGPCGRRYISTLIDEINLLTRGHKA